MYGEIYNFLNPQCHSTLVVVTFHWQTRFVAMASFLYVGVYNFLNNVLLDHMGRILLDLI